MYALILSAESCLMPESILTLISISSMVSLALNAIVQPIRPVLSQSARMDICRISLGSGGYIEESLIVTAP